MAQPSRTLEKCTLELRKGSRHSVSKLIKGDNLNVMNCLLNDLGMRGRIDLIYIDPPFSTSNTFRISEGKANSISRSREGQIAYDDNLVGEEYLGFLKGRLLLMRELLSDRGSIYLHIDYKIGHYVKVLMDEIFGPEHFINDITRIKCNPKNFERKGYGNIKDMILFYSKTRDYIWNEQRMPLQDGDLSRRFNKTDSEGRRYTTIPVHAPGETRDGPTGQEWRGIMPPKGRHWRSDPRLLDELDSAGLIEWSKNGIPRKKIYADESRGKKVQDIWEFKDPQNPDYPTEKNSDLLKLIVSTSSDENSIVLDAFCGSGTTLKAAQDLGRNWIGIDRSDAAISSCFRKIGDHFENQKEALNYAYLEEAPHG